MTSFLGSLHKVSFDKEGESKVTFTVPLSDIKAVSSLANETEKCLKITVEESPNV